MIQKINERIFVIGSEGSANVVIVLLPKGAIIVDTTLFPEKAQKIREFVENVLRREILFVVNTHYHPDHIFGNIIFEDKQIISSNLTREKVMLMDERYLESLPVSSRVMPASITFEDEYKQNQILIKRVGGHTPDSSIVYLEQDRILITGDLVFNGFHAEIVQDSNPEEWLNILEDLKRYKIDLVIPGHGDFLDKSCLDQMKRYLTKIQRLIDGTITYAEILADENFSTRRFPELFSWGIENLMIQRAK